MVKQPSFSYFTSNSFSKSKKTQFSIFLFHNLWFDSLAVRGDAYRCTDTRTNRYKQTAMLLIFRINKIKKIINNNEKKVFCLSDTFLQSTFNP